MEDATSTSSTSLSSSLQQLVVRDMPNSNDRWVGVKILEFAVANVVLRALSVQATETEFQQNFEDMLESFQYEKCYRKICQPSERCPPDTNFRNLVLDSIGHIYRQGKPLESHGFCMTLEEYVIDPRRNQKEKFIMPQGSSENKESKDSAPSLPFYTSWLQEYGVQKGSLPRFQFEGNESDQPGFICRVTMGDLSAVGREASTKKNAKHEASRELYLKIRTT